jgi:hypothetical protein
MEKTMEYALEEAFLEGIERGREQTLEKTNSILEYDVGLAITKATYSLRMSIIREIEQKREKYLKLVEDKTSVDYQFYLGVCNGMNFAKVIVENPSGN